MAKMIAKNVIRAPSGKDTYITEKPITKAENVWREGQDLPFVFLLYKGLMSYFS